MTRNYNGCALAVMATIFVACSSATSKEDRNTDGVGSGTGGKGDGTGAVTGTGSDFVGEMPIINSSTGGSQDTSTKMDGGGLPDDDGGLGDVCGMGTAEAKLTPVNMLVMFDRSGSMNQNNKWVNATAALTSFFENPGAAGLRVALRFFPHDNPAAGCQGGLLGACDTAACAQPLVPIGELTADAAPTDAQEGALVSAIASSAPGGGGGGGSGTPIYPALEGALQWASNFKAMNPTETTVVIFVTDGEPNGCNEDINAISALAANALATSGVPTYAIGLEGSNSSQMDQIAMAGGTGMGIYIGNSANAEQELLDALNAIRGKSLSCNLQMPEPVDPSMPIDPATVNLTYTSGSGMAFTVAQVADSAACGDTSSWYYDDPVMPTNIILCPKACDIVAGDSGAKLEILLGCETLCSLDDPTCTAPPDPPPVPPVLK